ncbi:MAG TPA: M1 family metallopeptidase [Thermoanaerobaculia bacterium]|nr:M1 family metallopeptidase [Thermoanaerobaculia bacterium]
MTRLWLSFWLLLIPALAYPARLPRNVIPSNYQLTLAPDLSKGTFEGEEIIHLKVRAPGSQIVLHAVRLSIREATLTRGRRKITGTVAMDPKEQTATISFPRKLSAGGADLHILFSGELNNSLRGFYLSRGKGRNYAVTQFESTDARRAFPCFDEPDLKATFDVTMIVDLGDTAISNGAIVSDIPGPGAGKHTLRFSQSAKISTYLVAMAVGDFQCLTGAMDGIPIRICATPDKKNLGSFALESAQHILHFYDRYYGQKYPFSKLDILAVPDFAAGAMENAAAIFYRETALLIDDKTASIKSHRTVADVLAHEMAHMWFGDLVTMKWWDDIWLNEGFATWMTSKPVAEWKPEWNVEAGEARTMVDTVRIDTLQSTRAIRTSAETPEQIRALFDAIAYKKTSSVLRMLENYTGEDVFRKGINLYLSRHAWGNATGEDFWNTMTEVSGKPVAAIMKTYVDNPGVPLLTVGVNCSGTETRVRITQEPWKSVLRRDSSSLRWSIPVCFKSGDPTGQRCELLDHPEETYHLRGCQQLPLINAGAKGYFITDYGKPGMQKLAPMIEKTLSPEERLSLAGDEWALVRAGRRTIGDYLTLLDTGFRGETDSSVLTILADRVGYIGDNLVPRLSKARYQYWVAGFLGPAAQQLGWTTRPGDSDEQRKVRAIVFERLGRTAEDPEVLTHARDDVEALMKDVASVDAALAEAAFIIAAEHGDVALYERMVAHIKTAKSPEEFYRYVESLASFRDPVLIDRTIAYALSDQVREQDRANLLIQLTKNPAARPKIRTLLLEHFDQIRSMPRLTVFIKALGDDCDAVAVLEMREFFGKNPVPGTERTIAMAVEQVQECSTLKQQGSLDSFLQSHGVGAQ